MQPGDAVFLGPDHRIDPLFCRFGQSSVFRGYEQETRLNYATDIALLLTFPSGRNRVWTDARERDLDDFRSWRLEAPANPALVGSSKWNRELAAFSALYRWADRQGYVVASPVTMRQVSGLYGGTREVPEGLRKPMASDMRWLTPRTWRLWTDVGLRGHNRDGAVEAGWASWAGWRIAMSRSCGCWSPRVRVLERIVPDGELLFDAALHNPTHAVYRTGSLRNGSLAGRIEDFVAWANHEARTQDLPGEAISGPAARQAILAAANGPVFQGSLVGAGFSRKHAAARRHLGRDGSVLYDNPNALLLCLYRRDRVLCATNRAARRPQPRPVRPRLRQHRPHRPACRRAEGLERALDGAAERSNGALTIVALAIEADVPRDVLSGKATSVTPLRPGTGR